MEKQKKQYVSPQIEVIQMESEGIIASSIDGMGVEPWSSPSASYGTTHSYSASGNDLEDMINDILTVGE